MFHERQFGHESSCFLWIIFLKYGDGEPNSPVHSWTILLSPMNWYLMPRSCRTVRDSNIFNFMSKYSIFSFVCKELQII